MNNGNLTEQSSVIKSIDSAAYIENHVSPHCQIDGMSASEYVRTNTLHQIEIARLNTIIERQRAEMVVMQAEIDLRKEISGRALTRDDVKRLALSCGFKLKQQADGSQDLNNYVYEFASALREVAI